MIRDTKLQIWTVEAVQQLRDMAGAEVPPHIISIKLGRSIETIYRKLAQLGISYRPV
jgi:hypothetical protein